MEDDCSLLKQLGNWNLPAIAALRRLQAGDEYERNKIKNDILKIPPNKAVFCG